jgi:DEAD/DEAH box helicase domain-containing protein
VSELAPLDEALHLDDVMAAQIAYRRELPCRLARFKEPSHHLDEPVQNRLAQLGIEQLFSHQADAYDAAREGKDVVIVTGTNSGKTLCYNLPALHYVHSEPVARMLYLFPTKALAQDQLTKLTDLLPTGSRASTYDGDTPPSQRGSIRRLANIVLTNPDMLHVGILPGHELWTRFFKSLRLIVIDEMHVYRGVFGSHVCSVLRRLLRLAEWHKARPQIIACSATIGNPAELFEKLTGRRAELIEEDGSPRGKRTFVFWNPPEVGEGQRLSSNIVSSELIVGLAENGQRVLGFNRARISAELVLRYSRKRAEKGGKVSPASFESYRAGYTPKERREIEQALFKGKLLGLSATNAMELGVDVGSLDAVVMNGYPGSIASFWQQAGRAGRGSKDGLAIMVAHDDPLEQFLIREPGMLLDAHNERVAVSPDNPQILAQQLRCAAHERPLAPSELERFTDRALEVAESLDRSGELRFSSGLFYFPSHEPPAPGVNIRGTGGELITLRVEGVALGTMERWRAMQQAHAGAVYLHRGESFVVQSLDLEKGEAIVKPEATDYYTQSIVQSVVESKMVLKTRRLGGIQCSLVGISVTDAVVGFRRKTLDGDTVLSLEPLDLPPSTYETLAVRFDLPMNEDPEQGVGGVHGFEHALLALAPLLCGCDRGDLGSAWYSLFPDTLLPAVFVMDRTPGGVGLAERLYDSLVPWTTAATQLLRSCDCDNGCPACLLSPRCEINNEALSKKHTLQLMARFSDLVDA